MTRRVLFLVGGALAFWLATALPFRFLADDGNAALILCGTSLLLCLVPTTLTLLWGRWALHQNPHQQLLMVVGGTGIRMFTVLLAGLGLHLGVPYFQERPSFWTWLLVCYLFTLALEMVLLVGGTGARGTSQGGST